MKRVAIASGLICAVASAAGSVAANDGPPSEAWISAVEQQGQDVVVSLRAYHGLGEVTLNREGDHQPVEVFSGTVPNEQAAAVDNFCTGPTDEEYCEDHDGCSDCDGDGVDECEDGCIKRYEFDFTDECVPPGAVEYVLYEDAEVDAVEFAVEDVGQDCPLPPALGDGSGCSTSGLSAAPAEPLVASMLAIGLIALAWRRTRR